MPTHYILILQLLLSTALPLSVPSTTLNPPPHNTATTTHIHYVGSEKTPIIEIDNVLPNNEFQQQLNKLRARSKEFYSGENNGVSYPGKIARLDRVLVQKLIDVLLLNSNVLEIYPKETFQIQYTHAFAAVLCQKSWIHTDKGDPIIKDLIAPAAVFYFDSPEGPSGTVFYRERNTNFERLNNIVNVTKHCIRFANQSYACGGQHNVDQMKQSESSFQKIHTTKSVPNRFVIYPQDLLHAQLNPVNQIPKCSVNNGRLSISVFFLKRDGLELGVTTGLEFSRTRPHLCSVSVHNESESLCTPLWIPKA